MTGGQPVVFSTADRNQPKRDGGRMSSIPYVGYPPCWMYMGIDSLPWLPDSFQKWGLSATRTGVSLVIHCRKPSHHLPSAFSSNWRASSDGPRRRGQSRRQCGPTRALSAEISAQDNLQFECGAVSLAHSGLGWVHLLENKAATAQSHLSRPTSSTFRAHLKMAQ